MPELKIGEVVEGSRGSYQVTEKFGAGGYGAVFKALDQRTREFVIIKQMIEQAGCKAADFQAELNRFRREAHILIELAQDERIVKGYELIEAASGPLFVMEMINGRDLASTLGEYRQKNNQQPFPADYVVPIGIELCRVIDYLHRLPSQIIYRDLKPANVMWDAERGTIRLIDFGTARFADKIKKVTVALGTQGYAPPELFNKNADVTFSADVYTIGATLYELLTGSTPYQSAFPEPVRHFQGYDTRIPVKLQTIILKSLEYEAKNRFPRASDMMAELSKLSSKTEPLALGYAVNPYPLLCCFCPRCGSVPRHDRARFCPNDRTPFHAAILSVISKSPDGRKMDLFITEARAMIGRADPESNTFPDLDLSRFDPDLFVSRKHAVIERRGPTYYLTHISSVNPTKVDGIPLAKDRPIPLQHGARIEFADLIATFEVCPIVKS